MRRWAARPTFYYEAGGLASLCGGFYAYNLEVVPVSSVLYMQRKLIIILSYSTGLWS
jgi:hypothetical protein